MATGITVGDVMRKAVVTAKKEDPVSKIAMIMKTAEVGGVIILENNKIVGMLTEGDIIRDVISAGKDYKKLTAKNVMKSPVKTVDPNKDVEDAIKIMGDVGIERLPVVSKGRLVGIITERDITRVNPAMLEMMKEKGNLERVPVQERDVAISGECEECGNFSTYLRNMEGRYLCEDCR